MRISDWSSDVCSSDLGWCYVREVTMPTYARKFAENGFNALIIDYRNLGVSGGDNRQHLDPWAQIRDYQNAISFLERHPAVDPDKIGAWRSEERRVGKEWVRTCRSRGTPDH